MCSNCTRQVVQFCVSYKYEVLRKKRRKCEKKRKNEERGKKKQSKNFSQKKKNICCFVRKRCYITTENFFFPKKNFCLFFAQRQKGQSRNVVHTSSHDKTRSYLKRGSDILTSSVLARVRIWVISTVTAPNKHISCKSCSSRTRPSVTATMIVLLQLLTAFALPWKKKSKKNV